MIRSGVEIRALRKRSKLSQIDLAKLVGVSRSAVYDWERDAYSPEGKNLENLAKALGTTVAYLSRETEDPAPKTTDSQGLRVESPNNDIQSNVHLEISNLDDFRNTIKVPVLSQEQTACCGKGIPISEITSQSEEFINVDKRIVGRLCECKMPYAVVADGDSMEGWGILSGSRIIINPVEEVHDFDIVLVCYRDNLVLKKIQRMQDGSIRLYSSDSKFIIVPAEEAEVESLFSIWGKAMSLDYHRIEKIQHGL